MIDGWQGESLQMSRVTMGVILAVGPELRMEGRGQLPLNLFMTPDLWTRAQEVDEEETMLNIGCPSWLWEGDERYLLAPVALAEPGSQEA